MAPMPPLKPLEPDTIMPEDQLGEDESLSEEDLRIIYKGLFVIRPDMTMGKKTIIPIATLLNRAVLRRYTSEC